MVIHNQIFDDKSNHLRQIYEAKRLLEKEGYKVVKLVEEMPHNKDHQGRTLEEEYRKILKSEGSDRAVINFLLTERYYAVKTMIMVRNESF